MAVSFNSLHVLTTSAVALLQVLIIGHVPPGYTTPEAVCQMGSNFNQHLINIVLRHSDVITAMHFGHEHHDSFRLIHNSSGKSYYSDH